MAHKTKESTLSKATYFKIVGGTVLFIVGVYAFNVLYNPSQADKAVSCQLAPTIRFTIQAQLSTKQLQTIHKDSSRLTCINDNLTDNEPNARIELLASDGSSLYDQLIAIDISNNVAEPSSNQPATLIINTDQKTIFTTDFPEDLVKTAKTLRLTLTESGKLATADEAQATDAEDSVVRPDLSEDAKIPTAEITQGTVLEMPITQ